MDERPSNEIKVAKLMESPNSGEESLNQIRTTDIVFVYIM